MGAFLLRFSPYVGPFPPCEGLSAPFSPRGEPFLPPPPKKYEKLRNLDFSTFSKLYKPGKNYWTLRAIILPIIIDCNHVIPYGIFNVRIIVYNNNNNNNNIYLKSIIQCT